jgi:hypothetical protein
LRDLYTDRHDHLAAYVRAGPCPPDTVGVIVGYGGRIVALELFDAPDMLQTCWPRLIRAAALDALAHDPGVAIRSPARCGRCIVRSRQPANASPPLAWATICASPGEERRARRSSMTALSSMPCSTGWPNRRKPPARGHRRLPGRGGGGLGRFICEWVNRYDGGHGPVPRGKQRRIVQASRCVARTRRRAVSCHR